jgi:hypothetical protein
MTNREAALAVLRYEPYDRLPIVHFGYWHETLQKWQEQGHLAAEEVRGYGDGTPADRAIAAKLGFDFNWQNMFYPATGLVPAFESRVVETYPDGSRAVLNGDGAIVLQKDEAGSIPAEIDHLLKGRDGWEEHYKHRLQFTPDRVDLRALEDLRDDTGRQDPIGLHCGSLYGQIRNWIGVEGSAYLYSDDPELFQEIIDTVGDLCYRCVELALSSGAKFDFAHFWEDICFKNGPLIMPVRLRAAGGTALQAHHGPGQPARPRHRVARLRRVHRPARADLAEERREHDVSHRGGDVEREHRSLAREVRARSARGRRDGQAGLREGPGGGRGGGRTPAAARGPGRLHSLPGPPHPTGRGMGPGAVLLRPHARCVRLMRGAMDRSRKRPSRSSGEACAGWTHLCSGSRMSTR